MTTAATLALGATAGAAIAALAVAFVARGAARRERARLLEAQRRAAAAERMAEIGALTGGLAHEIKNPLSTIGLNAQLIGEAIGELRDVDPAHRDRVRRRVDALTREIERLRLILSDFLEFAGEIRPSRRPTDLGLLAEELADFFLPQCQSAGVTLRLDKPAAPINVPLDPTLIKQTLLNLMLNAVQAMAAVTDRPRELILRVADEGQEAAVHVIDTGPGMDDATLARVFTPYFTTRAGGSGLGLPIARRIVEAHDGRVEIVTEPGKGADIVLRFPRSGPA